MIRQITLLSFFMTAALSPCFAQSKPGKSQLSISIGPSIPVGDFASTGLQNKDAGFALTGEEVNLSYTYLLSQKFGLTATLFGQRNGLNRTSMKQQWSKVDFLNLTGGSWGGSVPPSQPPPVYYSNWHFEKHDWLSAGLLLGGEGVFSAGSGSQLSYVIKGMAGLIYVASPELDGKSVIDTARATTRQTSASAWGFSYRAYGGLQYKISPHMNLLFGVNYLGTARMTFSDITARVGQMVQSRPGDLTTPGFVASSEATVIVSQKQVLQTIGVVLGAALEL